MILKNLLREENGATAIEYALIAASIALAIMGIVFTLGGTVYDVFYADLPKAFER